MSKEGPRYSFIDLFSGAGGLTAGFVSYGGGNVFEPVWANDFDESTVSSYNANFGEHCHHGDIIDILDNGTEIPKADLVIGGPPCQGFSLLNRNRNGDPRRHLWMPFMDVVRMSGAKIFLIENVPGLIGSAEHNAILERADREGFSSVQSVKLCAADYGVAQVRWRAFIVGSRVGNVNPFFPPKRTHIDPTKTVDLTLYVDSPHVWRTVRDEIGMLPPPVGTEIRDAAPPENLHFGRNPTQKSRRRYRAVPAGGNRFDLQEALPDLTPRCWIDKKSGGTDLFGRLWWDRPSVTIRTEFFKPEKGRYLHPEEHRPITHREAARLQSFNDGFVFRGSKIEIARQIGNAVPPRLAEHLASSVFQILRYAD